MTLNPVLGALIVVALTAMACGGPGGGSQETSPEPSVPISSSSSVVPKTVIASLGKLEPFETFESAEQRLGWRILRPSDPRFRLVRQGGLLRTLPEVGLPRLEQAYAMDGRAELIEIFQEPEDYDVPDFEGMRPFTIGRFDGELWRDLPHGSFFFYSGEDVEDQRVRVNVYTLESSDWSAEDFSDFVESLDFESGVR